MMSIQFLTRNLRRVASLRGFSSATVSESADFMDKTQTIDKQTRAKSSKSKDIFEKLKSLDDPSIITQEDKVNPVKPEPSKFKVKAGNSFATRIANAKTVSELLQLSESNLNQQNAMEILTKLSVWTSSKQANVKDFENDYRFLKICRLLSKMVPPKNMENVIQKEQQKSANLEMILSIAGDDEASKIVESLSLPQKVRVFSSLARKKNRSIPVLKTLASTISEHSGKMNLKECSDLLFAMTSLNFIDEMLLSRISIDINAGLSGNLEKTAVVGSIVTIMGFLKYKDPILLDNLTKWIIDKQDLCRPKDLASLVLTLALVNYRPKNIDELKARIVPKISRNDLSASEWLDLVWALTVVDLQQANHFESILRYLSEQGTTELFPAQKMKLLNVNAAAKHLSPNYAGPFLAPESPAFNCLHGYRKSKKIMIQGLIDTLKNLFTDSSYVRFEHNTNSGFIIDAECVLNESRAPLAVASEHKGAFRIAIMALDYHDMCKGVTNDPNGFNAIAFKLLEETGYHVLQIPHTEFSTSDKVLKRVQYIDSKLKNIVKQPSKGT